VKILKLVDYYSIQDGSLGVEASTIAHVLHLVIEILELVVQLSEHFEGLNK
jgi:hypothetical protein